MDTSGSGCLQHCLAEDDWAGHGLVSTMAVRKGEQMIRVLCAAQLRVPQADEDEQLLALINTVESATHLRILNIPLTQAPPGKMQANLEI
jgi:hypothetical protein